MPLKENAEFAVGRAGDCGLRIADPHLHPHHVWVRHSAGATRVRAEARNTAVRLRRPVRGRITRVLGRTRRVGARRWHTVREGEVIVAGTSHLAVRSSPRPRVGATSQRHASRWRSGIALAMPIILLMGFALRSGGRFALIAGGLLLAIAAGGAVVWSRRRRGRTHPHDPSIYDPAWFALWFAGRGEPPPPPQAPGRDSLDHPVHCGGLEADIAEASSHGLAVVGHHADALARWLRAQRPDVPVIAAARPEEVEGMGHDLVEKADRLGVSPLWAAAIERIRTGAGSPPRLLDVLGRPDSRAIAQAWRRDSGLAVRLGTDGESIIDLEGEGPHALIAGTTGSGKSELLLSWILALAAARPPSDLTVLLVDYKGGATFAAAAGIPHCAGVLTDLDTAGSTRALTALRHEVRRRERLLATAGARTREEFVAGGGRLPRLVVAIDELRALVEDDQDRLADLIAVATLGRSLGIHLILATQRPSGVITGQLRANLPLRICLRVTDPADSVDVLGHAGAAQVRGAGQALIAHRSATPLPVAWLPGSDGAHLAQLIAAAADRLRRSRQGDLLERATVWVDPLPTRATRSQIPGALVLDRPETLTHQPWTWDGGLLLISGPPGSGRTAALQAAGGDAIRAGVGCHLMGRAVRASSGIASAVSTEAPGVLARLLLRLATGEDPHAGVLIDDVEEVIEAIDAATRPGTGLEAMRALVRSRRTGHLAIVSASPTRWQASARHHLVLGPDRTASTLAGVPRTLLDPCAPPGRGVLLAAADAAVAQVVLEDSPAPADWHRATRGLMAMAPRPPAITVPGGLLATTPDPLLPIGVSAEDASLLARPLRIGQPWLVIGGHGSGRSTVLARFEDALRRGGVDPSTFIVLDDAERCDPATSAAIAGRLPSCRAVIATTPAALQSDFRGLLAALRDARTAIALGGYLPSHLDPSQHPRADPGPGRALLVEDGRSTLLHLTRAEAQVQSG